jgi:glycosyltransferase involved in cell wall biosynthesis
MNWEVILVEDGSKDRAEEILFAFNQSFTQKIFSIQGIMLI